ncbi:hypothetical protein Glove_138g48 [Diversispora epigaea]|uniref:Uncharacterized protein n=1 Tax=Diversispora epigaea TaxID=1348612 RepID=A0A397J047_9GLOM|nr:hypothetical protein Glove_138g48 [Diversispora epigaea]
MLKNLFIKGVATLLTCYKSYIIPRKLVTTDSIELKFHYGYICEEKDKSSSINSSATATITSVYQLVFGSKTKYAELSYLGLDQSKIAQKLLKEVIFCQFIIGLKNITVFISSNTINLLRKYSRINRPRCLILKKSVIVCLKMSEVKEKEFQLFFIDKANVNISSYKVDTKTQLPVLYLKDQKSILWEKFSATYSNGMKYTSFMSRLQNS